MSAKREPLPLIVVVEADETIRRAASEAIKELGYTCVLVRRIADATRYLNSHREAVFVADDGILPRSSTTPRTIVRLEIKRSSTGVRRITKRTRESLKKQLSAVLGSDPA